MTADDYLRRIVEAVELAAQRRAEMRAASRVEDDGPESRRALATAVQARNRVEDIAEEARAFLVTQSAGMSSDVFAGHPVMSRPEVQQHQPSGISG